VFEEAADGGERRTWANRWVSMQCKGMGEEAEPPAKVLRIMKQQGWIDLSEENFLFLAQI
jgi:hypothetical protein